MGSNAIAQDSENLLEEVTVTGSYIKSSRSDAASPVDVVDAAAIRRSGAFTIGEITAKLSVNSTILSLIYMGIVHPISYPDHIQLMQLGNPFRDNT
mgnify:CR=1 FL=1